MATPSHSNTCGASFCGDSNGVSSSLNERGRLMNPEQITWTFFHRTPKKKSLDDGCPFHKKVLRFRVTLSARWTMHKSGSVACSSSIWGWSVFHPKKSQELMCNSSKGRENFTIGMPCPFWDLQQARRPQSSPRASKPCCCCLRINADVAIVRMGGFVPLHPHPGRQRQTSTRSN